MADILQSIAIVLIGFVTFYNTNQIDILQRKHFNLFAIINDHICNRERHVNEE